MALRFMRAYRKARAWVIEAPAAEIAMAEAPFFPDVESGRARQDHRHLPGARQLEPTRGDHAPAWEATVDIFLYAGLITRRHPYESVIASPPGAA